MSISTTQMTPGGRIVIPEEICSELRLESGTRFLVIAEDSQITLKTLVDSDKKEFINSLKHISERAKKAGLTESDISAAVQQVRSKGS